MSSSEPSPSEDAASSKPSTSGIEHRPRTRAAGPRFDALPEFRSAPPPVVQSQYPSDSVQRLASVTEPRVGPFFVKYSVWAGGAAIAYTYLVGFRALYLKDRPSWLNTFRQRTFIIGPLITLYLAGANLIPMPFRSSVEKALGRPAISLLDVTVAEKHYKDKQREQQRQASQAVSDQLADQHIAATGQR